MIPGRWLQDDRQIRTRATAAPPSAICSMFAAKEQSRVLGQALQVLTPDERQAIETAFFSELTYSEAATRLNQPLGTVKTRIRSGLGKLRQGSPDLKGL